MESLLGFQIGFWDYATFIVLAILVAAGLALAVFVLGLPGRIAIARNHPEAEAVYLMGWIGFLAVVPWIQALAWAFRPTTVIGRELALLICFSEEAIETFIRSSVHCTAPRSMS